MDSAARLPVCDLGSGAVPAAVLAVCPHLAGCQAVCSAFANIRSVLSGAVLAAPAVPVRSSPPFPAVVRVSLQRPLSAVPPSKRCIQSAALFVSPPARSLPTPVSGGRHSACRAFEFLSLQRGPGDSIAESSLNASAFPISCFGTVVTFPWFLYPLSAWPLPVRSDPARVLARWHSRLFPFSARSHHSHC